MTTRPLPASSTKPRARPTSPPRDLRLRSAPCGSSRRPSISAGDGLPPPRVARNTTSRRSRAAAAAPGAVASRDPLAQPPVLPHRHDLDASPSVDTDAGSSCPSSPSAGSTSTSARRRSHPHRRRGSSSCPGRSRGAPRRRGRRATGSTVSPIVISSPPSITREPVDPLAVHERALLGSEVVQRDRAALADLEVGVQRRHLAGPPPSAGTRSPCLRGSARPRPERKALFPHPSRSSPTWGDIAVSGTRGLTGAAA